MIEALTYRLGPHSSSDDPTRYRTPEEVEYWRARDPIERMRKYLGVKGIWTPAQDDALRQEVDDLLTETIREVEKAPPPALETLFTDVYAEVPPHLREQMEAFLASGERRRPEVSEGFPL